MVARAPESGECIRTITTPDKIDGVCFHDTNVIVAVQNNPALAYDFFGEHVMTYSKLAGGTLFGPIIVGAWQ